MCLSRTARAAAAPVATCSQKASPRTVCSRRAWAVAAVTVPRSFRRISRARRTAPSSGSTSVAAAGQGGTSGNVTVTNASAIETRGSALTVYSRSRLVVVVAMEVSLSLRMAWWVRRVSRLRHSSTLGGAGGTGEHAGDVTVTNSGTILTRGKARTASSRSRLAAAVVTRASASGSRNDLDELLQLRAFFRQRLVAWWRWRAGRCCDGESLW